MPSNDHLSDRLTQAGQRAAGRSGATPPPLDSIRVEVARRQRSHRTMTGVVAALALVAIVPLAAIFFTGNDDPGVVTAASESEAIADATTPESTTTTEAAAAPVTAELDTPVAQDFDFGADLDENVDIQIQIGDRSYGLEVIVDDQAAGRASDAEAAAEDTRIVGDTTVWLRGVEGQTEASALVDDGVFAAATGPTEEVIDALDELGDLADAASSFFDGDTDLEGLLGDDFNVEDFLGDDFDPQQFFDDGALPFDLEEFLGPDSNFEEFFGEDFDPQQFFDDGSLPFGPEAFLGPDFDIEQFFGPNFDPQEFFGEGGALDLDELREQFESIPECFAPSIEEAEATGSFTFPDCDVEELTAT